MTHAEFLESLFARLAKWAGEPQVPDQPLPSPIAHLGPRSALVSLLERQPLFVLGSWDDIVASIMEFRADLVEDLADGLMMPFPSEFEFLGKQDGQFHIQLAPESLRRYAGVDLRSTDTVAQDMGHVVEDALLRVALISHPENYVVKRTPKLTPREQRGVARGEPVPVRKRPFYLVLDHDGLVSLCQESTSTASRTPVLHARRGHWMRLADRCKAARAQGRDRVWRRETYVGDREFSDSSGQYSVFMSAAEAMQSDNNTPK